MVMRTGPGADAGEFLALAVETSKRFEAEVRRLSRHAQELAERSAKLRASMVADATAGQAESLLAELEERDAEIALAGTQLEEVGEAFASALAMLARESTRSFGLFEEASTPYLVTDPRGVVGQANEAAAHLLAVNRGAIAGKPVISFVARQDTRAFRDWLHALRHDGSPHRVQVRVRPRGGTPFTAEVSVRFLPNWGSRLGGGALRWSITPAEQQAAREPPRVAPEALRRRMLLAVGELRTTIAAVQAWSQALRNGIGETTSHGETIEAIAQAAALPSKQLEELEELAREMDGGGARVSSTPVRRRVPDRVRVGLRVRVGRVGPHGDQGALKLDHGARQASDPLDVERTQAAIGLDFLREGNDSLPNDYWPRCPPGTGELTALGSRLKARNLDRKWRAHACGIAAAEWVLAIVVRSPEDVKCGRPASSRPLPLPCSLGMRGRSDLLDPLPRELRRRWQRRRQLALAAVSHRGHRRVRRRPRGPDGSAPEHHARLDGVRRRAAPRARSRELAAGDPGAARARSRSRRSPTA